MEDIILKMMSMFRNHKQTYDNVGKTSTNISNLGKNRRSNVENPPTFIQKPEIVSDSQDRIISVNYPQIDIRDAGGDKGLGVFAKDKVLKKNSMIVYGGVVIDRKEYNNLVKSPQDRHMRHCYIASYKTNKAGQTVSWVDAHPRHADSPEARKLWAGSFVNHAGEEANSIIERDHKPFPYNDYPGVKNDIVVRLTRDVQPGEEVTTDYGYSDIVLQRMGILPRSESPERAVSVSQEASQVRRSNMVALNESIKLKKQQDKRRKRHKSNH